MRGHALIANRHHCLNLDGTLSRVDDAWKLSQDPITGRVDDVAAVATHQWQYHGLMALQRLISPESGSKVAYVLVCNRFRTSSIAGETSVW